MPYTNGADANVGKVIGYVIAASLIATLVMVVGMLVLAAM